MRTALAALAFVLAASTVHAQDPRVTPHAFFLFTEQAFSAKNTFTAAFGSATQPWFGGGGGVTFRGGFAIDVTISRFDKTGQRAFFLNSQSFQTGEPLTVTINAIEGSAGYRFKVTRHPFIVPFVEGGIGQYHYKEASPDDLAGEGVDATHVGYLVNGGVEFRLQKWVGVSVDAQYTHIPGVLGTGGISQQANESDLGGIAARFKLVLGR